MKLTRRGIRHYLLQSLRVQGNMQIYWTPDIPLIYVGNPKAGCSSIKQSLKSAQAHAYERAGRNFTRVRSPHMDDDCLRRKGLNPSSCRTRHLFSCVRHPYPRVLSAYLDKVVHHDFRQYPELRGMKKVDFESFLRALAASDPALVDVHFRPQHINLNYPHVAYDAVFFLENTEPLAGFLEAIIPGFELKRFAPHARSAEERLAAHFDATTLRLVRDIYAGDFAAFGYGDRLEDALSAPGAMIAEHVLLEAGAATPAPPCPRRDCRDTRLLENTLRCRWLIERGLL